ncbi:hypothetical protein [Gordonia sp. X0973]|uniref:hypothetical protein n=1 Tax=Gordonia sp. X0973 TaxID=2742602 RepID=UPI000F51B832|nr:hypothetical protein [Gordonia sp. X0973]
MSLIGQSGPLSDLGTIIAAWRPGERTRTELRHNLSADDAAYVALAEALGATSLVTTDARLARAPGIGCRAELLS